MTTSLDVTAELQRLIQFHQKWRRITSFAYFAGASLSVMSAATASVVAGLGYAAAAAVVAAIATIVASLEKVLLFREKWTHHRAVETELEVLRLKHSTHEVDDKKTVAEIERIVRDYSQRLPLAGNAATA